LRKTNHDETQTFRFLSRAVAERLGEPGRRAGPSRPDEGHQIVLVSGGVSAAARHSRHFRLCPGDRSVARLAARGPETASRVSIVEAQDKLEGFYYFIFLTLAALITLIAPALTAGAVIGERQRQSLDLLITTPLSAGELLVGKMLSSIAFLGLLLGLSLPASALCVLLGGATIGDVFRIYALLAIDGVVLAAIGLFFSCASRTGLLALVWTYLTVTAALAGTYVLYAACAMINGISQPPALTPLLSLIVLNPLSPFCLPDRWYGMSERFRYLPGLARRCFRRLSCAC
jgi:hypothetical protein